MPIKIAMIAMCGFYVLCFVVAVGMLLVFDRDAMRSDRHSVRMRELDALGDSKTAKTSAKRTGRKVREESRSEGTPDA
jgi:hypothetical protein